MPPLGQIPLEVIEDALGVLDARLVLHQVEGPTTHTTLVADEIGHPDVTQALGCYLVGVVAGAVNEDALLSEELLARTPDSAAEVRDHVLRLIGPVNDFPDAASRTFRDTARNPWIAEIVAHALLVLRRRRVTPCLVDDIAALKQPHADPRRQGLDLVAIFATEEALGGLALGEAKASRRHGAARLTEAVAFFAGIDAGSRGIEIRQEVQALKHVLPPEVRATIADGFWRERCCYMPIVVHSDPPLDVANDNAVLGALRPSVQYRRLLALWLDDFYAFFDSVADAARATLDDYA